MGACKVCPGLVNSHDARIRLATAFVEFPPPTAWLDWSRLRYSVWASQEFPFSPVDRSSHQPGRGPHRSQRTEQAEAGKGVTSRPGTLATAVDQRDKEHSM